MCQTDILTTLRRTTPYLGIYIYIIRMKDITYIGNNFLLWYTGIFSIAFIQIDKLPLAICNPYFQRHGIGKKFYMCYVNRVQMFRLERKKPGHVPTSNPAIHISYKLYTMFIAIL